MSIISPEEIKQLAKLARLKIEASELEFYAQQLNNILQLGEKLKQFNAQDIPPMFHSLEMTQRLREDQVTEENQRETLLKLAPKSIAGLYLVPKVIE